VLCSYSARNCRLQIRAALEDIRLTASTQQQRCTDGSDGDVLSISHCSLEHAPTHRAEERTGDVRYARLSKLRVANLRPEIGRSAFGHVETSGNRSAVNREGWEAASAFSNSDLSDCVLHHITQWSPLIGHDFANALLDFGRSRAGS